MINYFNGDEWIPIEDLRTVKQVAEYFEVDDISHRDKLAQRLDFELDVWVFMDPKRDDKFLLHFDSKEDAEEEHDWIQNQ